MQIRIALDHVDDAGSVFTMTIVGDPTNGAAGTYRVDLDKPITLDVPTYSITGNEDEQGVINS